jgi:hypothetical protein
MGFKMSLDDVEPWKGGGLILRSGTHPIRVVDEEIKEPGKDGYEGDHPVVVLTLEAIGGEEQGGEIRDWVHITPDALGKVAQLYEVFGVEVPSGEFEWISIKGRQAKIVVREKPGRKDPSKKFSEVVSYTALAGHDEAVEALKGAFDASEVEEPGKGGGKDDDIPF